VGIHHSSVVSVKELRNLQNIVCDGGTIRTKIYQSAVHLPIIYILPVYLIKHILQNIIKDNNAMETQYFRKIHSYILPYYLIETYQRQLKYLSAFLPVAQGLENNQYL
jgi:hypothetical protein